MKATKVSDILQYLCKVAPIETKMDFDNVGHLVGWTGQEVSQVLVSLDITDEVIDEAVALNAQLIVSHHPVIFYPAKQVTDDDLTGRKILNMVKHNISAICMHTNLDAAQGGVNDALAAAIGLTDTKLLNVDGELEDGTPYGIGRVGVLPEPMTLDQFMKDTLKALNGNGLKYYDAGKPVHKVGVVGGSGGDDLILAADLGCDTFVTADIKYNVFLNAKELGINLIDGDHYSTENVICPWLKDMLIQQFLGLSVTISGLHKQTAKFFVG